MKASLGFLRIGIVFLATLAAAAPLRAQLLGLSAIASPNPVQVSNTVTFSLTLTNLSPDSASVIVTNSLPVGMQFLSAGGSSSSSLVTYLTNGQDVIFQINTLTFLGLAQLSVTAQPLVAGSFTNRITAVAPLLGTAFTNLTVQVLAGQTDLGVTLARPAPPIFVNDWMTYTLSVANKGPADAPDVLLTSPLPDGVTLVSVAPTNLAFTVTNGSLRVDLGVLTNGGVSAVQVTVQPSNPATVTLSGNVSGTGITDSNSANDTATAAVLVAPFLPGQLQVTNVGGMHYDPQTGLMDQTVALVNLGTNPVAAARVFVQGLTNVLYSAVGTNDGRPYVVYAAPLAAGQAVNLALEYYVPSRHPIADLAYAAAAVALVDLTPPVGTPLRITRVLNLSPVGPLIEFPSVAGQSYTVVYSNEVGFTNAQRAVPPILAPADRVQWIDDGPPKTVKSPASVGARFYRVLQNP